MKETATILDACCGSKMFWFDKENPNVLFVDKRSETLTAKDKGAKSGIRTINVSPDMVADFTEMPFEDNRFHMVVFDPPSLKNSWRKLMDGKKVRKTS